jgi:hypothetical protein
METETMARTRDGHIHPIELARAWIRTDPQACLGDIERLGLDEAAEYNLDLAQENEDSTWHTIMLDDMWQALRELMNEAQP